MEHQTADKINHYQVGQSVLSCFPTCLFSRFLPQNNRVRRFAFELKMQDKSSYLLAADSEAEMEEWVTVLNKILQLNFEAAMQEKRNGDPHEGG